jgi:hypothetical protein
MSENYESTSLIGTRLSAGFAACYAGFLASWRISFLLAHRDPRPLWVHTFDGVLPQFTWAALSLLVYGTLIYSLIRILREMTGAERLYCVLFLADPLLHPFRQFLPMPGPGIVMWLQAVINLGMFLTAVQIFISIASGKKSDLQQPSQ